MLSNNINFEYNKLYLKEVTVLIPKNHPNLTSFLTPLLGLHGIDVKKFLIEFLAKTQFLGNIDIILPISVTISKIKTFSIFFKTPYISALVNLNSDKLNILSFYKFFLIKSVFNNAYFITVNNNMYRHLRVYLNKFFKNHILLNTNIFKPLMLKSSATNFFKKRWDVIFYRKVVLWRYGVFIIFPNYTARKAFVLKNLLKIFNLNLIKCKSRLISNQIISNLNNLFYIGSFNLNYFLKFFELGILKDYPTFKIITFRWGSNLVTNKFLNGLRELIILKDLKTKTLKSFSYRLHVPVKTVYFLFIRLMKIFNFLTNIGCQPTTNYKRILE